MPRKQTREEQKEISAEAKKLVEEWERTGEMKTSRATYHPETKEKAIRQALAIEYGKHRVGRAGQRKKKAA